MYLFALIFNRFITCVCGGRGAKIKGIESEQGTPTDILAIYFALDLFTFGKMVLYKCECVRIFFLMCHGAIRHNIIWTPT